MAVASRNIDKAKAFVAENNLEGVATPYGSYQELLDNAGVDAVYIPLPCALHKEWVLKAAAAGKHILMEKPLAMVRACYVYTTVQPNPHQPSHMTMPRPWSMRAAQPTCNIWYVVGRPHRPRPPTPSQDGTMWLHNPRTPKIREVIDQGRVVGEARTVLSSLSFVGMCGFGMCCC